MRLRNYLYTTSMENCKKFHEHLYSINEIFDKDVKLEVPKWDGTFYSISFNIDNEMYHFKAKMVNKGEYSILFYKSGAGLFDLKGSERYSGDIFAAIKKSLQSLIKDREVNMFWFNSDEPKLKRLYDVIYKRMENEFIGFEFYKSLIKGNFKFWIYKRIGYSFPDNLKYDKY